MKAVPDQADHDRLKADPFHLHGAGEKADRYQKSQFQNQTPQQNRSQTRQALGQLEDLGQSALHHLHRTAWS